MQSNTEQDLIRFKIFIRIIGLIDQIETFDMIRDKYIPGHYNHLLRVTDQKVPKRRRPGFLTPFLFEQIEAVVKSPPSIVKHPVSNLPTEVTDYKIGSSTITSAGFPVASFSKQANGIQDYVNESYAVLYLNGEPIFSANLWRPRTSKSMEQIFEPLKYLAYRKSPPLIFGKKNYFKEHILPSAIQIMIELEKYYSELKIHTVFCHVDSYEVNLLNENLEEFFCSLPNITEIRYYY